MITLLLALGSGCDKDPATDDSSVESDADTDADTDTDTDTDADADADTDTDADADGDADADMTGEISLVVEEANSHASDTCSGYVTVGWIGASDVAGEWSCDFAGMLGAFGTQTGTLTGATTSATEISGDISDSGAMGTVPWHGTYTATTVEGGFEVSYSESGYVIAGTGSFSASE